MLCFNVKKAIGPVIAISLLLIISVISVVGFQSWFNQFSSNLFVNVESDSNQIINSDNIESIIGDKLYINAGEHMKINSIQIDGIICDIIKGNYSGRINFNVGLCLNSSSTQIPEINVITDKKILTKYVYIKDVGSYISPILEIYGYNSTLGQFIGGNISDSINSIVVDSLGNIIVGGYIESNDISDDLLVLFKGNNSGNKEGFVLKFDLDGNSLWGQWIGGNNEDVVNSISVDLENNIYVGGFLRTESNDDFLVSFNGVKSSGSEGFILKLDSDGNSVWGQWIGRAVSDTVSSIFVYENTLFVGGYSGCGADDNLITFNGTCEGNWDGYITSFDLDGNSLWGQWLGDSGRDYVNSIFVKNDYIYAVGRAGNITESNILSLNGNASGNPEGFLVKFDLNGTFIFGQLIGTMSSDNQLSSIVVDSKDNIYVTGHIGTPSIDDNLLPFSGNFGGSYEHILLKFDSMGNNIWNKYIGAASYSGAGFSKKIKLVLDKYENIYFGGYISSNTLDDGLISFNGTYSGGYEGVIIKFNSSGDSVWGQYLGDSENELINSIFVDKNENIYVAGYLKSNLTDDNLVFFNGNHSGGLEGYFTKFSPLYIND